MSRMPIAASSRSGNVADFALVPATLPHSCGLLQRRKDMKSGKEYSVKNQMTGEIVAENVSYFEAARLICEELPYRGMNLSQRQIDFLKSGGDAVVHQGNELLNHHEFHYPSRENPSERFTIMTRRKWTQGHDDYEAFVMIEHDEQRQDARFVRKDEEGPHVFKSSVSAHIYTTILNCLEEKHLIEFPPTEEESAQLRKSINRQLAMPPTKEMSIAETVALFHPAGMPLP